jgi:hypothetical protein
LQQRADPSRVGIGARRRVGDRDIVARLQHRGGDQRIADHQGVDVGQRQPVVESEGPRIRACRLLAAPEILVRCPQLVLRPGRGRVELEGALEVLERICWAPSGTQQHAEIEPDAERIRPQAQSLPIGGLGAREILA